MMSYRTPFLSSLDYLQSIKRNPLYTLHTNRERKTDHFILSSLTDLFTIERIKIELGIIETSCREKQGKKIIIRYSYSRTDIIGMSIYYVVCVCI